MRIEDLSGELKTFEVVKKQKGKAMLDVDESYWPEVCADVFDFEEGVGMAVHYQELELQTGESFCLPPATIGVHPYRWERCWENYRRWVNTWYEVKRARPGWWRAVFVHKALHQQHFRRGDDYIAPENKQEYEWDWHFFSGGDYVPVEELVKPYDDMYNWDHWMASRGDYDVRTDWGGPEAFARYLQEIQGAHVRNALYMEVISVERGSNVGRACGERWAVLRDRVRLTSGPPHREYAFCPGVPGWHRHIAHEVVKVLRETRCDAIYLDSVGLNYWLCEDASHHHSYRRGYHRNALQLLEEVNEAIDRVAPDTVLYLEFWSTDVATQYMSGCFSPVVTAGLGLEGKGKPVAPTGTNLFRFYFPNFKIIEIMPENRTGIELAFFNGNAIHGYLNTEATLPTIERLAPIWRANLDCFTSDDVEALLETGVCGVYMNRFGASGKQLYTVWNALNEELSEVALPVVVPEGWHAIDLLNEKELKVNGGPGDTRVVIALPGRSLSVFAVGEGAKGLRGERAKGIIQGGFNMKPRRLDSRDITLDLHNI